MKSSSVHLDRMDSALKKAGISIKRSQLLEVAASAFGFHNSNEFTAAAKRGDLDPPAAKPIGTVKIADGKFVIIVNDGLAGMPYGIDRNFIGGIMPQQRAERFGISPYGNLLNIADIETDAVPFLDLTEGTSNNAAPAAHHGQIIISRDALGWLVDAANRYTDDLSTGLAEGIYDDDAGLDDIEAAIQLAKTCLDAKTTAKPTTLPSPPLQVNVYTATIDHKHGTNAYAQLTEDALYAELASYCVEYWSEVSESSSVPDEPNGLSDRDIVRIYFDDHETEALNLGGSMMDIPENFLASLSLSAEQHTADDSTPGRERCSVCECILMADERTVCRSHTDKIQNLPLPTAGRISEIAGALEDGASADIWFDAGDYEGEEDAENTIEETQSAMTEAARILRLVAGGAAPAGAPSAQASGISKTFPDSIIWLTDLEGEPIFNLEANLPFFQRIGLDYDLTEEFKPLTKAQEAVISGRGAVPSIYNNGATIFHGPTVVFNRQKFHAPTLDCTSFGPNISDADLFREFDRIESWLVAGMRNLGGHILRTTEADGSDPKLRILLPFSIPLGASSFEAYFAAVDYLVNGEADEAAAKVIAKFEPKAIINEHFVDVDGDGPKNFDVTFELLLLGHEICLDLSTRTDLEDLRYAQSAPAWIQTWSGPYDVKVDQNDVDTLFKICR